MKKKYKTVSQNWLLAEAEFEFEHGHFGVAGTSDKNERTESTSSDSTRECRSIGAFAQLVEFGRRRLGLSIEDLAAKATIDLEELVEIERSDAKPSPRALHRIAQVLQLPAEPLAEVAGLVQSRDEQLEEASYRFAARSEPNSPLSPQEEDAYNSYVSVILTLNKTNS